MTLSYRLTFRDRLAFAAYHLPRSPLTLLTAIGLFLIFTFKVFVPAMHGVRQDTSMVIRIITFIALELLLAFLIVAFYAVMILLSMISRRNKALYCEKTITLGDEAFTSESQYGRSEVRWTMVQKLARTRRHIIIYLSQEGAVMIPRRAFENSTLWDAFYDVCKQRTNGARQNP